MTVVVTNLPKVMDIFSDILSKSRFEQRPIPGNFSPRPNPKKNTTKGTKPTSLTKEFKPVPGTYNYRRDPDSTAKPKGKTAERELISDGATSDDATFVEGLEKSDRTIQQAKKADKARNRDAGQAAMQGRQERLTGMRPTLMTTEMRDTRPLGYMATDPEKVGIIRGQRRRANRRLDSEEARRSVSDTTKKRQAAMSAAEITGRIQKAVYGYLHKNRRPIRQKANQEKLKGLLDAGKITQEGYDDVMSGKRGSAPAIRTGLDRAQRDEKYRKDMGLDIRVSEAESRAAKFRREGYPKGGTDYRTGKKPAAEEDKPHVDTQGTLDLGMLKAFGVMKSTGGRHGLHPVERRPKTVTEKADGGEEYSSGARGRTPALLGMAKALADGMTPEQKKRIMDKVKNVASRYDEFPKKPENPKKSPQKELPFSTEDRDNIAPTPDPHGDNLPEPKQRGGTRQGSKRHGEIPKEGWKEAALLYPAHRKEQQGGRKVKTRVGDSPTGYPT